MKKQIEYPDFLEECETEMKREFKESKSMRPMALFFTDKSEIESMKFSSNVLSTDESICSIINTIRQHCMRPDIVAASLIFEVDLLDDNENKTGDGLMNILSTPQLDEVLTYTVDRKTREVLSSERKIRAREISGRLSGFFSDKDT